MFILNMDKFLNNDCMGKNFRFHAALNALFLTDFFILGSV